MAKLAPGAVPIVISVAFIRTIRANKLVICRLHMPLCATVVRFDSNVDESPRKVDVGDDLSRRGFVDLL